MLRIGLVELAPLTTGGAATYAFALRQALEMIGSEVQAEVVVFANEATSKLLRPSDDLPVLYRKHEKLEPFVARARKSLFPSRQTEVPTLPDALKAERIDLAWFLAPNRVISNVKDTPFVMTVWDLGHRDVQGFPEFASDGRWAQRESGFAPNLGRAFHVMTDSRRTGQSLETIYGVYPHNWSSLGLPLPAPTPPDQKLAASVGGPYFYYPASYWPHKNHRVVIEALKLLPSSVPKLVFSGHDEGHRDALEKFVTDQGLAGRVIFHGRISDGQVAGLIDESLAVVMPSLLGPTNYPPLEALRLGKPALVSSVHEFDEITSNGLIIVGQNSPSMWAKRMGEVFANRESLAREYFEAENPAQVIREVIDKFVSVQKARLVL